MDLSAAWPYLTVFGLLLASGLGAPIPEELPIVGAGVAVGHASEDPSRQLHWWIMVPVCIAGVVVGDFFLYTIGRLYGQRLLKYKWVEKHLLPPERRERIEKNFHEYGITILLFARVLPGIRSPIFIMSGIMRVPLRRFVLADGIYAIPGVNLLFWLAFWFGDQFRDLIERAEKHRSAVILGVLAVVGLVLFVRFLRRPVSVGDPQELPILGKEVVKIKEQIEHSREQRAADAQERSGVTRPQPAAPEPPPG